MKESKRRSYVKEIQTIQTKVTRRKRQKKKGKKPKKRRNSRRPRGWQPVIRKAQQRRGHCPRPANDVNLSYLRRGNYLHDVCNAFLQAMNEYSFQQLKSHYIIGGLSFWPSYQMDKAPHPLLATIRNPWVFPKAPQFENWISSERAGTSSIYSVIGVSLRIYHVPRVFSCQPRSGWVFQSYLR